MWKKLAKIAKYEEKLISAVITVLVVIIFLYGGLGLYNLYRTYKNAQLSNDIAKYDPSRYQSENENMSLSELKKINPDVVAWLKIPDTKINYPVVHGKDDFEYLNKGVTGEFCLSGSIFLAVENKPDFSDPYSIIYGHHMEYGEMFGQIPNFLEADFFKNHEIGYLYTEEKVMEIHFFAAMEIDSNSEVYNLNISNKELLDYIVENSVQLDASKIDNQSEDRIVALSTCSEASTNGRILLFGFFKN